MKNQPPDSSARPIMQHCLQNIPYFTEVNYYITTNTMPLKTLMGNCQLLTWCQVILHLFHHDPIIHIITLEEHFWNREFTEHERHLANLSSCIITMTLIWSLGMSNFWNWKHKELPQCYLTTVNIPYSHFFLRRAIFQKFSEQETLTCKVEHQLVTQYF
jgi:hypothetical protein